MKACIFPGCKHKSVPGTECTMHKVPSSPSKCRRWTSACRISGSPRTLPAALYVCSCHFPGRKGPSRENPDPAPAEQGQIVEYEVGRRGSLRNKIKYVKPKRKVFQSRTACSDGSVGSVGTVGSVGSVGQSSGSVSSCISPNDLGSPGGQLPSLEDYRDLARPLPASPVVQRGLSSSMPSSADVTPDQMQDGGDNSSGGGDAIRTFVGAAVQEDLNQSDDEVDDGTHAEVGVQVDLPAWSYERAKTWEVAEFRYFTGITATQFEGLYKWLGGDDVCSKLKYNFDRNTPKRKYYSQHSAKGKLFMTLVRLRRGFSLHDMEVMFGYSSPWLSAVFYTWIRFLSIKFRSMEKAMFASVASQKVDMPDCYKPFPNLRCVVDATEFFIQKPENMEQQSNTYSSYKSHCTAKFLVATSLYGGLSFISDAVEGSMSDRKLFSKSGIMSHLNAGEAVMADRGFDIEADLNRMDVELLIPPFLGTRDAFTARELILSKAIAAARIHVETFIGRIKEFKLVRYVVPNTMLDIVSDIVRVCACLVNFQDPFIRWKDDETDA